MNDLFAISTSRDSPWSNLSGEPNGVAPTARASFGFASVKNKLFVFGGQGAGSGECLCEARVVSDVTGSLGKMVNSEAP